MAPKINKYMPILDLLLISSPQIRKSLLTSADDGLIKLIIECCFNLLVGAVKVTKYRMKKIKQHKDIIRKICNPAQKLDNTKKILIQTGGSFLPVLLPAVLPTLKLLHNETRA
jgi:hypothetical protein